MGKNKSNRLSGHIARILVISFLFTALFIHTDVYAVVRTDADEKNTLEVPADTAGAPEASEGELLVVFEKKASVDAETAADIAKDIAKDTVSIDTAEPVADKVASDGACVLVTLDENEDTKKAKAKLEADRNVAYVQPNFKYRMMETSHHYDSYIDEQYALKAWDESFNSSCGANVSAAWELMGGINKELNKRHVTIAVMDSGCQVTHEDLKAVIDTEHAYDAVNKKVGTEYIRDTSGHGTHVSGIAAGVAENGTGIAGAAGNYASILPINVFVGQFSTTKDQIAAFDYLENLITTGELKDLHVINMSLGGYGELEDIDIALKNCIARMRQKDVLTVCAGGNGDEAFGRAYKDNPCYPGDFEECLCVTSLDSNGMDSDFSDYSMDKDISAPGSGIISTFIDTQDSINKFGKDANYKYLDGTSMASPLVAGIAGMIFADNPDITCDQVVESLRATAHRVNPLNNHEGETGSAGAVDAAEALKYARDRFDNKRERLNEKDVTFDIKDYVYDGETKKPAVTVIRGGKKLTEGVDYLVSYTDNVEPGTAHVAVSGIKNYIGTVTREYKISKIDINNSTVSLSPDNFKYDGSYHFPSRIEVSLSGKILKWGVDYSVTSLNDGIGSGEHKILIEGRGHYTGSKSVFYSITDENKQEPVKPDKPEKTTLASAKVTGLVTKVYNGKNQTQSPKITLNGVKLVKNKDYKLTYKNQKNVGKATVIIKGKGKYTGSLNKTFDIIPKSTSIKGLTPAKKALTIKWSKLSQKMSKSRITGYQIRLSTDKSFSKNTTKTFTVNGYSKVSKNATKLLAKKKYYTQVRTYMTVGKIKYYSKWSAIRSKKTK